MGQTSLKSTLSLISGNCVYASVHPPPFLVTMGRGPSEAFSISLPQIHSRIKSRMRNQLSFDTKRRSFKTAVQCGPVIRSEVRKNWQYSRTDLISGFLRSIIILWLGPGKNWPYIPQDLISVDHTRAALYLCFTGYQNLRSFSIVDAAVCKGRFQICEASAIIPASG